MEIYCTVLPSQHGWKLKRLMYAEGLSASLWKRIKWNGRVTINGEDVHNANTILSAGDEVICSWREEPDIVAADMDLDILYEDEWFLAVNKPSGMLIHPTRRNSFDSLVNGIAGYFRHKGDMSGIHPVYRLDRDTTGIVLVAKSAKGQYDLSRRHDLLYREYIGLASGIWSVSEGLLDMPIGRKEGSCVEWMVRVDGKHAQTEYVVTAQHENYAEVRLHLLTGRTHQIRVHLSHEGHPLLGDTLYGGDTRYITRQALHARFLQFVHPETAKMVTLTAPLPEDMRSLCRRGEKSI